MNSVQKTWEFEKSLIWTKFELNSVVLEVLEDSKKSTNIKDSVRAI